MKTYTKPQMRKLHLEIQSICAGSGGSGSFAPKDDGGSGIADTRRMGPTTW